MIGDFVGTKVPMSMIGTTWQPDPDGDVYAIYYSKSPINIGKWSDPEIDRLLQEGRTTYDVTKRADIYHKIEYRVADQCYLIYPYNRGGFVEIWRNNVHGYATTPGNHRVALRETWLA